MLGSLQSPITNLARVLNQIAEQGGAAGETAEAPAEEAAAEEAPAASNYTRQPVQKGCII